MQKYCEKVLGIRHI